MIKTLALCIFLVGCTGFDLQEYDPLTVEQVLLTISQERAQFSLLDPSHGDYEGLEILHESEIIRLKIWLSYEQAKKLED